MLSVEDIHTYYGDSYVLQGVSIEVRPGEVVAILGRNGVGKTTLVRSVIELSPPRRGRESRSGDRRSPDCRLTGFHKAASGTSHKADVCFPRSVCASI